MKAALVQQVIPGSTGTQDYTDANVSSDLKLALLSSSSAAANATNTAIARFMLGVTDGTTHRTAAIAAANGVGTSQCIGNQSTNAYQVINSNGGTNETAAFSSVLATGLRINWTAIGTQRLINALLLSGSDVTATVKTCVFTGSAAPETVTVTHGLGGVPNVLYAFSYLGATRESHGFYDVTSGAYASHSYCNLDGQVGTTQLGGYVSDSAIIRQVSNIASEYAVTISNVTATTFDVTATGAVTSDTLTFVCLRVTGATTSVGILSAPTSTGNVSATGMTGAPILVMTLPTRIQTLNSLDNGDGAGQLGLGIAVNNSGVTQQLCSVLSSDDAAATTVERSYTANDKVIAITDATGAVDVEATLSTFNADGFTWNFSNVSGLAYLLPYMAIGLTGSTASWQQVQPRRTTHITL